MYSLGLEGSYNDDYNGVTKMNALNIYSTSQIAKIIGIHPNTVRLYEDWGLVSKPPRKVNGYRIFSEIHIDQFKLARTALHIEVIQSGMRRTIIQVVKLSAKGQYDKAIDLTNTYINIVESEISNATEAVEITNELMRSSIKEEGTIMKRKEVSDVLGITMDTLRNWEMNGLIQIKRKENGYRVYNNEDIKYLKIIRSLRCANYSLSSIKRMMNVIFQDDNADAMQVLNTPNVDEDIVSVCDKLIISLDAAKVNAKKIINILLEMKSKYSNPPV